MSAFVCSECGATSVVPSLTQTGVFVCAECGVECGYEQAENENDFPFMLGDDGPVEDDGEANHVAPGGRVGRRQRIRHAGNLNKRSKKAARQDIDARDEDDSESSIQSLAAAYLEGVQELLKRACSSVEGVSRREELCGVAWQVWERHVVASTMLTHAFTRECLRFLKDMRSGQGTGARRRRRAAEREQMRSKKSKSSSVVPRVVGDAAAVVDESTRDGMRESAPNWEGPMQDPDDGGRDDTESDMSSDEDDELYRFGDERVLIGSGIVNDVLMRYFVQRVQLYDAICVLYIACRWLREPLLLSTVMDMVSREVIPLLSWNALVSKSVRLAAPKGSFVLPVLPAIGVIFKRAMAIVRTTGAPLAPVNLAPVMRDTCARTGFPVAAATWAMRLLEVHDVPPLTSVNLGSELGWAMLRYMDWHALHLPDVWVAAALIAFMRRTYGVGVGDDHDGGSDGDGRSVLRRTVAVRVMRWAKALTAARRRRLLLLGYASHADAESAMPEDDAVIFLMTCSESVIRSAAMAGETRDASRPDVPVEDFINVSQSLATAATQAPVDETRRLPATGDDGGGSTQLMLPAPPHDTLNDGTPQLPPPPLHKDFAESARRAPVYGNLVSALSMHVMSPATIVHRAVLELEASMRLLHSSTQRRHVS